MSRSAAQIYSEYAEEFFTGKYARYRDRPKAKTLRLAMGLANLARGIWHRLDELVLTGTCPSCGAELTLRAKP